MSPTDPAMEAPKESTAKAKEPLQIEDAPRGQPTTYGPVPHGDRAVAISPFWSEKVKDEALLRSIRPQGLPEPSSARSTMGPEDGSRGLPDMRQLMSMVLQQNAQLKQELDDTCHRAGAGWDESSECADWRHGATQVDHCHPSFAVGGSESDVKSEEIDLGPGADWRTPPESVFAKKSQGSV